MNESGDFKNYAAQYTADGIQILAEGQSENIPRFLGTVTASEYVGGDPAVLYNLDDSGFGTVLYRFTETGLEPIEKFFTLGSAGIDVPIFSFSPRAIHIFSEGKLEM